MWNWLRELNQPKLQLIHPPWRVGQYVTYFLERDDGIWTAFALRLLDQSKDGVWILSGDFKTRTGESTVWFRSDPTAVPAALETTPVREESVRGSPDPEVEDLPGLMEHHMGQLTLAMNLLFVRRWPSAAEALRGQPRRVRYPCGINQVYPLVVERPGYQENFDLCPQVMLTGVACSSIDGNKNLITVTSFGQYDPTKSMPTTYDDVVDLSHPIRVDHEGFALTYPATWFLRPEKEEKPGLQATSYAAHTGGNTCALSLSVSLFRDAPNRVAEERETILRRLNNPSEGLFDTMTLRKTEVLALPGDAQEFVLDFFPPKIDGVLYSGIFSTDSGDRLAHVILTGCIAKANPHRQQTREEMESVFPEILRSFCFTWVSRHI